MAGPGRGLPGWGAPEAFMPDWCIRIHLKSTPPVSASVSFTMPNGERTRTDTVRDAHPGRAVRYALILAAKARNDADPARGWC